MKGFTGLDGDKQSWKSLNQENHGSDNLVINNHGNPEIK